VLGVGDISKHPLTVGRGPGTGSPSDGQLSRLSIGRIGLLLPGGGRQMGACCQQTALRSAVVVVVCLVERDTDFAFLCPPPASRLTTSPAGRPRFAAALPRLRCTVSLAVSGRADGLLSIGQGSRHAANHSAAALHLVCAGHAATDRPSCWRTNLAH
jgi:hypothetical protein